MNIYMFAAQLYGSIFCPQFIAANAEFVKPLNVLTSSHRHIQ